MKSRPESLWHRPARRSFAAAAGLALLLVLGGRQRAAAADAGPLLDLDAAALEPGPLTAWANAGSAGGELAAGAGATVPVVADVGGRRAVSFGDGRCLTSSFKTPAELTGGHPFTLAAWAFAPAQGKRDVMVSWASRPNGTAEFGYGPGTDGAFFGWDKAAKYAAYPPAGAWHVLAHAYADGEMSVYVDGVLDGRHAMKLSPKPGGRVVVGAGWNGVDQKPAFPFKGSLARVRAWGRALTHREVRNAAGQFGPFDASPADGATTSAEAVALKWQPGDERAASYAVRFAADAAGVAAAAPRAVTGTSFAPPDVGPGRAYAWRVDQMDAGGKVLAEGPVWTFATDAGPAAGPQPRDKVANVRPDAPPLAWTPGRYARSQAVYFGTDRAAVAAGSVAPAAKGLPPGAASLAVPGGRLEPGRTYFWRVEQDNGPAIPAAAGEVWAFRTADAPPAGEVTFFVGSDCHYGLGNNAALNRGVIDRMNWLPGTPMPPQAGGGTVGTPRGVVLNGDLLDKGFDKTAPAAWAEFVADYGLTGTDGRLAFPVYEGFGNHDGMTGKSVTRAGVRERNKTRPGLTAVSPNGFHYSWDWGDVHLVQLNLFPGTDSADCIVGPPNHHPEDALGFFKQDLAEHVGDSGKTVVVFHHYCYAGGMADWWTEAAKDRAAAVMKPYRVAAIHGHSHGAYFYNWKGMQVVSDGSTARPDGQTGDFLVVRVTPAELHVAQRKADGWGVCLKAPLPPAAPAGNGAAATPRQRGTP
jgi:cytolysin (calcineurin-like family phosphatase)